jgi:hypothetical protein
MNEFPVESTLAELARLRGENARLKSLLRSRGIPWEGDQELTTGGAEIPLLSQEEAGPLDSAAKIRLFRRLFRGRTDVYAVRWESTNGKSGYTPACEHEWRPGLCGKPQVRCAECEQRMLKPVTDQAIYDHLVGKHTIGFYPLMADETCFFLAVDFDEADWREDAQAFMQSCNQLQVPVALEISRSGNGAHIWIFFAEAVPAREARRLGAALISYTCARERQLKLSSYDRFFPNQDTLPKGGFGNLIALPLQKKPREQGRTIFVDERFEGFADQWAFLGKLALVSAGELENAIQRASSTRADCAGSTPAKRTCVSTTTSSTITPNSPECGTTASMVIGRWGMW